MSSHPRRRRDRALPIIYHVQVCGPGSSRERRHLPFRDYLRAHAEEVEKCAALKRDLAGRHPGDRLAYIAGKTPFLEGLERRALAWRASSDTAGRI